MKIPFVEGWQNQKVAARSYTLSNREREDFKDMFKALHN
jgi:hypothetical protein